MANTDQPSVRPQNARDSINTRTIHRLQARKDWDALTKVFNFPANTGDTCGRPIRSRAPSRGSSCARRSPREPAPRKRRSQWPTSCSTAPRRARDGSTATSCQRCARRSDGSWTRSRSVTTKPRRLRGSPPDHSSLPTPQHFAIPRQTAGASPIRSVKAPALPRTHRGREDLTGVNAPEPVDAVNREEVPRPFICPYVPARDQVQPSVEHLRLPDARDPGRPTDVSSERSDRALKRRRRAAQAVPARRRAGVRTQPWYVQRKIAAGRPPDSRAVMLQRSGNIGASLTNAHEEQPFLPRTTQI